MKPLKSSLAAFSALALLATAGGALAQDRGDREGDHHGRPQGGGSHPTAAAPSPPAPQPQARPQGQGGGPFRGRGAFVGAQPQVQGQQGQVQAQGRGYPQGQFQGRGYQGYQGQGGQAQGFQGQYQGQGYRGGQGQGYQGQYRGQGGGYPQYRGGSGGARGFSYGGGYHSAFRAAPYRFPGGYGYRRYSIHQRFPSYLLLEPYYLYDYNSYFLSPPPGPEYRWVRYGPDAVLVDTYTGDIVDVAYGVFYEGEDDGGSSY